MGNKKKMTILDFKKYKEEGRKFSFVTAYDYTTASIVDESDNEIILVGDSLGMIMLGYDSTVPVTMEDMIHHIKPVVKGAPNTFIIGDMPFGSYNESIEQAIHNATRLTKETNCDCVKLEGGASVVETVRAIVKAGVNVMGHIGLTPQFGAQMGGNRAQYLAMYESALDGAAAQHPVQFSHAGGKTELTVAAHLPDPLGFPGLAHRRCLGPSGRSGFFDMFFHGIERAAAGAATHPPGRFISAAGAEKYGFCLSHGIAPYIRLRSFAAYRSYACSHMPGISPPGSHGTAAEHRGST